MEQQEWTPGQQLFMDLNPIWDTHNEEAPIVDEERFWQAVASILEPREVLVLELRFGRCLGYNLPLKAVGAVLRRENDSGIGVTRQRASQIELKALRKLRRSHRFALLQEATSSDIQKKSEEVLGIGKNSLRECEFSI